MSNMIDLKTRLANALQEPAGFEFETFLVSEGLELLAEFRSIGDTDVRLSILEMVKAVAASHRRATGT